LPEKIPLRPTKSTAAAVVREINPKFNYAGAAFGPHARYRTVCSIDFAGGYAERAETLVARNP